MTETESNELSNLTKEFKRLMKNAEKREEEWQLWLEKMKKYMSHGLFDKKYRDALTKGKAEER